MLTIENRLIPTIITLLADLPLSGVESRARTRFINQLTPHMEALGRAEYDLICEHATTNHEGQPLTDEDGGFTFPTPEAAREFHTQHGLLLAERALLAGGEYEGHHDLVTQALTNTEQTFSGIHAAAYDALLTALENEGKDHGSTDQA